MGSITKSPLRSRIRDFLSGPAVTTAETAISPTTFICMVFLLLPQISVAFSAPGLTSFTLPQALNIFVVS